MQPKLLNQAEKPLYRTVKCVSASFTTYFYDDATLPQFPTRNLACTQLEGLQGLKERPNLDPASQLELETSIAPGPLLR